MRRMEGGGFGGGGWGCGGWRWGLTKAEVVEDIAEVGEVDGLSAVEVAGGPGEGLLAKVVENGGEIGEVDGAVGVGVAEEFGGDQKVVGFDGFAAECCEVRESVIEDGEGFVGGECSAGDAGGVGAAVGDLVL